HFMFAIDHLHTQRKDGRIIDAELVPLRAGFTWSMCEPHALLGSTSSYRHRVGCQLLAGLAHADRYLAIGVCAVGMEGNKEVRLGAEQHTPRCLDVGHADRRRRSIGEWRSGSQYINGHAKPARDLDNI